MVRKTEWCSPELGLIIFPISSVEYSGHLFCTLHIAAHLKKEQSWICMYIIFLELTKTTLNCAGFISHYLCRLYFPLLIFATINIKIIYIACSLGALPPPPRIFIAIPLPKGCINDGRRTQLKKNRVSGN